MLRKKTQAAWRERNPEYAIAWRLQRRGEDAAGPRVPRPLNRVPWDIAKDEFGAQGAEILGCFGRLLVLHAKDEMKRQGGGSTGGSPQVSPSAPKAEIGGVAA